LFGILNSKCLFSGNTLTSS